MAVKPEYVPEGALAGMQPPEHAPREVTQPLTDTAIAQQLERAAANEQALKPLEFQPSHAHAAHTGAPTRPPVTTPGVSAVDALQAGVRRIRQVFRDRQATPPAEGSGIVLTDAEQVMAAQTGPEAPTISEISAGAVDPPKDGLSPVLPHMKAASDTDSPSRGVPRAVDDPGKRITGGFGDPAEAQYFPLDGSELRELVYSLMDQIHARLQDDLRFTLAVTYPRVSARVEVIIEGWPVDQGFTIPAVMPPHDKTPVEIARERADEIVFVVRAARVEMTQDGESVTPPNAVRQELGLTVPRKQAIQTPTGRQLVDLPN